MTKRIVIFRNFEKVPNKRDTHLNVALSPLSVSQLNTQNPWSRDLEKLLVLQPVKTLPVSYEV